MGCRPERNMFDNLGIPSIGNIQNSVGNTVFATLVGSLGITAIATMFALTQVRKGMAYGDVIKADVLRNITNSCK